MNEPSQPGPPQGYDPAAQGSGTPPQGYEPAAPQGPAPPGPSTPPRSPNRPWLWIVLIVLIAVLSCVAGFAGGYALGEHHASTTSPQVRRPFGNGNGVPWGYGQPYTPPSVVPTPSPSPSEGGQSNNTGGPANISAITKAVAPGLVDLNVTLAYNSGQAAATGMVISSTGEVLTNNHVVRGAGSITATDVGNGKTYKATVVGYDRSHDVAVLQLSGATGLSTVPLGDSSTAAVGQAVVAIGNAGGRGGTPSAAAGAITAVDQSITAGGDGSAERLSGLIEVNAAVRSGDSGGPLVNAAGQTIGMNTAASATYSLRQTAGQGYAIPINQALSIAKQIESGVSTSTVHIGPTAFLGVELSPTGAGIGGGNGTSTAGAHVAGVLHGTPAAKAGLKSGDVVTSFAGRRVTSATSLTALVGQQRPGDQVKVVWVNASGARHAATVRLISGPPA